VSQISADDAMASATSRERKGAIAGRGSGSALGLLRVPPDFVLRLAAWLLARLYPWAADGNDGGGGAPRTNAPRPLNWIFG